MIVASECSFILVNVPMHIVVFRLVFLSNIRGIRKQLTKPAFGEALAGIIFAHAHVNLGKCK